MYRVLGKVIVGVFAVPIVLLVALIVFVWRKTPGRKRRRASRVIITFDGSPGECGMGKILKIGEGVGANVTFKDSDGNVAPVDGKPTWAFDNDSVAELQVSEDGMSAFLKAKGVGQGKLQVSADADMGEGIVTIIGEADLIVEPKQAMTVEIQFGEVTGG